MVTYTYLSSPTIWLRQGQNYSENIKLELHSKRFKWQDCNLKETSPDSTEDDVLLLKPETEMLKIIITFTFFVIIITITAKILISQFAIPVLPYSYNINYALQLNKNSNCSKTRKTNFSPQESMAKNAKQNINVCRP